MALTLPKLDLPKLTLDKKQISIIAGAVVVLAAAGWFGWQYFGGAEPAPVAKTQPVTAAKQAGPAKAAADAGAARDKLIGDLLLASGLKRQLDQLPQQFIAGTRQSGKQKSKGPALDKTIESVFAEAYTAEGFNRRMGADLKKNFDEQRVQALLKDYSTPAAKRMVELGQAAPSPAELARFARSPAAPRPSSARAGLVKRIDAASRASDLAVEAAFTTMKAIALGVAGEGAGKAAAVDKAIEKERASSTQRIRSATLLNLAFSLKDASEAELEAYAKFYETENSKWFTGIVYASILEEVKSASARAGERIGALAGKRAAPTDNSAVPADKSTTPAAKPARSKAGSDARTCLGLDTNQAIIKCAEQYR